MALNQRNGFEPLFEQYNVDVSAYLGCCEPESDHQHPVNETCLLSWAVLCCQSHLPGQQDLEPLRRLLAVTKMQCS